MGTPALRLAFGLHPGGAVRFRRGQRADSRASRIEYTTGTSPTATISRAGSAATSKRDSLVASQTAMAKRVAAERAQQRGRRQLFHDLDEHEQRGGGDPGPRAGQVHVGEQSRAVGAEATGRVVERGVDPAEPRLDGEQRERVEAHDVRQHQSGRPCRSATGAGNPAVEPGQRDVDRDGSNRAGDRVAERAQPRGGRSEPRRPGTHAIGHHRGGDDRDRAASAASSRLLTVERASDVSDAPSPRELTAQAASCVTGSATTTSSSRHGTAHASQPAGAAQAAREDGLAAARGPGCSARGRAAAARARPGQRQRHQDRGELQRRSLVEGAVPDAVDRVGQGAVAEQVDGAEVGQRLHHRKRDASGQRGSRERQRDVPDRGAVASARACARPRAPARDWPRNALRPST